MEADFQNSSTHQMEGKWLEFSKPRGISEYHCLCSPDTASTDGIIVSAIIYVPQRHSYHKQSKVSNIVYIPPKHWQWEQKQDELHCLCPHHTLLVLTGEESR